MMMLLLLLLLFLFLLLTAFDFRVPFRSGAGAKAFDLAFNCFLKAMAKAPLPNPSPVNGRRAMFTISI